MDPNRKLTSLEKEFVKHMSRTNDMSYSVWKAGYKNAPAKMAYKLRRNQAIINATREETKRFLADHGGGIGIGVLVELALDVAQPGGIRRAAANDLAKLSGVAVTERESSKDISEMTGHELANYRAKLEQQREALDSALADRARPVIEGFPAAEVFE